MNAIEIQNLSKKYIISHQNQGSYLTLRDSLVDGVKNIGKKRPAKEEFWALKDIGFEVKQGDRLGIIGRNGAGKSTLLKVLSRITEPTTGHVKLRGRVASLLEVGTGFNAELTGRENIFLNGAILGMGKKEIESKFDEIVAFAEVEQFIDTPVKRYSSGMYMRLAFAVAAHLDAEIMLVDEVLAVGDINFQKKCLGKMEDIGDSGRTIIFVSHNNEAIKRLCDKVVLLDSGKVKFYGKTDEALEHYNEYSGSNLLSIESNNNKSVYLSSLNFSNKKADCKFEMVINSSISFNAQIALGIDDENGNRVTTVFSKYYDKSFDIIEGSNTIVCECDNFLLKPGIYKIDLFIGNGFQVVNYSENITTFQVSDYSIYPSKIIPDDSQGSVMVHQKWEKIIGN